MKKIRKKILIIGSNEKFSLENMYFRAFKLLNYQTHFHHAYNIRKNFIARISWKFLKIFFYFNIRKRILKILSFKKNYYDLIIIFKGLYITETFTLNCFSNCFLIIILLAII